MLIKCSKPSRMIKSKYCLLTLISVFFSSLVFAQMTLSPREIEFKDVSQSQKVFVTYDGKPVLPGEITKIVSGVHKSGNQVPETAAGSTHISDYSFMFDFKANDDGSITLTPKNGLLEIGTYDLFVHTIYGTVTGSIDANLRGSIPVRPLPPTKSPRFTYDIKLPDYSNGQLISIDLGPDTENIYSWYIDGEVHSSGLGNTSFRARPATGTPEISFIARDSDGVVVSTWSDTVNVSE